MPQPYNYILNVPSPSEAFQTGMGIAAQKMKIDAQRQEAENAANKAQLKAFIFSNLLGPGATKESRDIAMGLMPEEVEQIMRVSKLRTDESNESFLNTARTVYGYLITDNKDKAIEEVNAQAEAYKNYGDTENANAFSGLAQQLKVMDGRTAAGIVEMLVRAKDPDAADKMVGPGDAMMLMRSAGIDPYSDEGRGILRQITYSKGQIILSGVLTPDGNTYVGTLQDYLQRYGGAPEAAPAATQAPAPTQAPAKPIPLKVREDALDWLIKNPNDPSAAGVRATILGSP
ncbi:MAG: hypothetical protein ACO3UV_08765 [Pseudomonadales bacterium]